MAKLFGTQIDFLGLADTVAKEKNIDSSYILEAMEVAMQKATRLKYGGEHDIRVQIDRKNGAVRVNRYIEVVEDVDNPAMQISLQDAKKRDANLKVGDFIIDSLPPVDFSRIGAQTAKQVIMQKVREAEKERQYQDYKDRVGEIVNGIVKRVEYGNVTIDLGSAEGYLRRDETIPKEHFRRGDRVRAYIYEVSREHRTHQILLSRTHPQFLVQLFKQEVPEIYDGVIEVKGVARDPGSRAKIGVFARDPGLDPVGSCVGVRGSRVQAVVNELQGEKIDIVPWNAEIATYAVNALAPAEVTKVIVDEEKNKLEMVVPSDQLSKAIGRRGQNVRLASILVGHDIDVLTSEQEDERRQAETGQMISLFMQALDVDDVIARLLVTEGFTTVEDVAYIDHEEMASIDGFEDIATEIQARAVSYLKQHEEQTEKKMADLGIQDDLRTFDHLTSDMVIVLGEAKVCSLEDFADLSLDELCDPASGILSAFDLSKKAGSDMIMKAREQLGWFDA